MAFISCCGVMDFVLKVFSVDYCCLLRRAQLFKSHTPSNVIVHFVTSTFCDTCRCVQWQRHVSHNRKTSIFTIYESLSEADLRQCTQIRNSRHRRHPGRRNQLVVC